jgi:ABC-type nitrate/sulfonate/bicarbonate transport system permease component
MILVRRAGRLRAVRLSPAAASAALVLAVLLLMQAAVGTGLVSSFLVPSPLAIAAAFPRLIANEALLSRTAVTSGEVVVAAASATALGGWLGWLLYRHPDAWRAFAGLIAGVNATPLILVYPLLLVIVGRSLAMVVVLGIIGALPPLILKTREAFAAVPRVFLDVAGSFNLTPAQCFRLIQLPAAIPVMATGFRMGVFHAVASVIGGEFLTGIGGLGALVPDLAERFELPEMSGAIAFIVLISATFLALMKGLERWLRPR